jgi:H+/Cl- antiporter ClcA
MSVEELFEVAVKVIGLLSFGRGIGDIVSVLFVILQLTTASVTSYDYYNTLKWGIIYTCLGLFLLRATSFIVNFAYPYKESKIEEIIEPESSGDTNISN